MTRAWMPLVAAGLALTLGSRDAAALCIGRCGVAVGQDGVVDLPTGLARLDWVGTESVTLLASIVATPGSSQALALLPDGFGDPDPTDDVPAGFRFTGVRSGLWYDPPGTYGFEYYSTGGSLFTLATMPVGFVDPFAIWYGDDFSTFLGEYAGGQSANFAGVGGVSRFKLLGINPTVNSDDPAPFPIYLEWDQAAGNSFTMVPLFTATAVPEPGSVALLATGLAALAGFGWRRRPAAGRD